MVSDWEGGWIRPLSPCTMRHNSAQIPPSKLRSAGRHRAEQQWRSQLPPIVPSSKPNELTSQCLLQREQARRQSFSILPYSACSRITRQHGKRSRPRPLWLGHLLPRRFCLHRHRRMRMDNVSSLFPFDCIPLQQQEIARKPPLLNIPLLIHLQ
jgi:hypothetical protein